MSRSKEPSWEDDGPEDDAKQFPVDDLRTVAAPSEHDDGQLQTMFFTVSNPPGTVAVTASADGRPVRVDLAPHANQMTESQLGEEISLIARLASQNARAGQHLLATSMMEQLGHDRASTRAYVEHELGLPSPETVLADKASVFAARYADPD